MEYYKGYICVTVDELTDKVSGDAVMSMPNYKQLAARKRINIVRKGRGLDGYVLVDFTSLPERFKVAFIAKYGNPEDVIKAQSKGDAVLEDGVAREWYA
ncbi:MAG: kinase, partial [Rikenellaceae bacterium]